MKNLGPCTPLIRVMTTSAVALGPEIQVTSGGAVWMPLEDSGSVQPDRLLQRMNRCSQVAERRIVPAFLVVVAKHGSLAIELRHKTPP